jgi:protein PhnA
MEVKDSNGNVLSDGDTVTLIKDLKVRGSSLTLKRGTVVKKIKLTDIEDEVDCRVNGSSIVLRTEFLKKS